MSTVAGQGSAKQRKKLAPAFVVTVGLALQIAACGGNVDDGSGAGSNGSGSASGTAGSGGTSSVGKGGSGGANAPACPAANPYGKDCVGDLVCSYPAPSGCPATKLSCVDGRWSGPIASCNPPAPASACPTGEIVEGSTCYSPGFTPLICGRSTEACDVTFTCDGATSSWKKTADTCATCPDEMPSEASACPREGLSCDYSDTGCSFGTACKGGKWSIVEPPCNPPPPQPPPPCPATPPPAEATCTAGPGSTVCSYETNGCAQEFACKGGKWLLESKPCVGPTEPLCDELGEKSCNSTKGCRWLVPACGQDLPNNIAAPGCFPYANCKPEEACPKAGTTCQWVDYHPCYNSTCASCAAQTQVCL